MHKSFAFLTALASVVLAQTIPNDISDSCSKFLNTLDSDKDLGACTSALTSATSTFAPGSDAAKNATPAKVTSALTNVCASNIDTTCSDTLFGGKLTALYSACSAELTSKANNDVVAIYDVLYSIPAYRSALCSQDDSGDYCVTKSKLPSTTSESALQKVLALSNNDNAPNATTFGNSGLLFLFTQATASSTDLCTTCVRKVMSAYTTYEGKVPYGPGLGKSPMLQSQTDLYSAITNTCGASFFADAGVVKAAGGISNDGPLANANKNENGAAASGASFVFASMGAVLYLFFSAL